MARPLRILAVTVALSAAGALFGAVTGAAGLAVVAALTAGPGAALQYGDRFALAGFVGAVLGAVLAPAAAWLLLRHVPLGRAVGWSVLGAVGGSVSGWLIGGMRLPSGAPRFPAGDIGGGVLGAVAGFVVAAIVLRFRAAPSRVGRGR